MPKLGLALSGGGFRATLYHLGVVRSLRNSGALQDVSALSNVQPCQLPGRPERVAESHAQSLCHRPSLRFLDRIVRRESGAVPGLRVPLDL